MRSTCLFSIGLSSVAVTIAACGGGTNEATGPVASASTTSAVTAAPPPSSAQPVPSSTPSAGPAKHFGGGKLAAALKPASSKDPYDVGRFVAIATDENDDPAVAFVSLGDKNTEDSTLFFSAWDPLSGAFTEPKPVATIGSRDALSNRPLSLAYDPDTHTFAIAFIAHSTHGAAGLDVAMSKDRGATWQDHAVFSDPKEQVHTPNIALSHGAAFVTFARPHREVYATGSETGDPSSWSQEALPAMADHSVVSDRPVALGIDGSGAPAVAYWTEGHSVWDLVFYRPKTNQPKTILETKDSNTLHEAFLGFVGASPHVIVQTNVPATSKAGTQYLSITSTDGATWTPPVAVGADGKSGQGITYFGAVSPSGQGVIGYTPNTGGGVEKCGKPKLATTSDFTTWSTCSPDTDGSQNFVVVPPSVAVGFDSKGRVLEAFSALDTKNAPPKNIWIYRMN